MSALPTLKRLACIAALSFAAAAGAEDIDLFEGGADITGNKPNVMIFVDNSANWNRNDQGWDVGKQGESELTALNTVIGSLTGDVRVGLMFFVKGAGSAPDGGYVRFAVRDMDASNRTALQNILSGIYPNFNDQNSGQQVASANAKYGEAMYEVYKYFSGGTAYAGAGAALRDYAGNGSPTVAPYTAGSISGNALSGSAATTYASPLSEDELCAKNYLIFIGNGFPSNSSAAPSSYGDAGLGSFNATQVYDEGNKTTYADEWSRFLYQYGAVAPCDDAVCANGKIVTYTIDVYKDHQDTAETSLLKSMATVGGGKYFAATSQTEIQTALTAIFNEVQAVDSVFTSASLPVSVNTQGTYLNQIYMGVFRPDATGAPRWLGNLKQYKFGLTTDAAGAKQIFLADATGAAAVNTQTGFISPNAQSYWTTASSPVCSSDAGQGFWCFSPTGVGADKDLPDGDLVEKGAAAQKLRAQGAAGRTMYTCTPACTTDVAPAAWSTSNASLMTALAGTSANVTALTRSGTTVTVTTSADLGLNTPTDTVTISGSDVAAYNTSWTATKVDATHFTFSIAETPATPATGSAITAAAGAAVSQAVTSGSAMTMNPTTHVVSVYLPSHGFVTGQSVTIAGADVSAAMAAATTKCTGWPSTASCEYNGIFSITKIDANNFSYAPPTANFGSNTTFVAGYSPPETFATAYGSVALSCKKGSGTTTYSLVITNMTRVAGGGSKEVTVTATAAAALSDCNSTLTTGSGNGDITAFSISGSNAENAISGSYTLTNSGSIGSNAAGSKTFKFNVTATATSTPSGTTTIEPASPATGTLTATGLPTRSVASIVRGAGNTATVTVTTATTHGFTNGNAVTIAGADQSEYNGTFTIANVDAVAKTFTYTITTGPATSATGGTVAKGSTVDAATLIDWVRGTDNKDDENANGSLADVRASIHGDVLHSRPLVINYGGATGIYGFYGGNDGVLRAVKGGQETTDGSESWSFVAPEHYSKLGRLYLNSPLIAFPGTSGSITPTPSKRDYFFDGNLGVFQSADLATTHIFVSMRRGGRSLYAFDVSSPTAPKFLWKQSESDSGFSELGQTWSEPKVMPIRKTAGVACNSADPDTYTRALVFGAGYDAAEEDKDAGSVRTPTMGRGIFVLNAADGSIVRAITLPYNAVTGIANASKRYSVPSEIQALDSNGDGCFDRLYVGDTGANLFRVDIDDADATNWKAYKLAALGDIGGDGGSDDRKFLYPPDVVLGYVSGTQIAYLLAGTGDREQPRSTTIADKFFLVKDTVATGTDPTTLVPIKFSDLTQVTDFDADTTTLDPTQAAVKGWYIDFETGEKAVNAPLTVGGVTFFGTNRPLTAGEVAALNSCTPDLGVARGYAINFLTGTAAYDRGLYTTFVGGGLPPSPVSGVVQIDGENTMRFVIGSGGTGSEGSSIEGAKIEAAPSSRRTRAFWYFRKDE
ncbi:MAG: hypothetical protein HZC24_00850 [Rhodocyclales bacterium]|nr:hypothetical protein [Rhodocyclales bacterium]